MKIKTFSTALTLGLFALSVCILSLIGCIEETPQVIRVPEPFKSQYWNYTDSSGVRKHTSVWCGAEDSRYVMVIHGITDTFRCNYVSKFENDGLHFISDKYYVIVKSNKLVVMVKGTPKSYIYNR